MPPSRNKSSRSRTMTSKSPKSKLNTPTKGTKRSQANAKTLSQQLVAHVGGCHCGAVRFSVKAPAHLDVVECNCSVCTKKQNHHFIVPKSQFTLLQGSDSLTTYTFNTGKAEHTFCKVCGVQSFYTPRSNQDGYGIMPHCIDAGTIKSTTVTKFEGTQWEASIKTSNLAEYSKEPAKKRKRV